MVILDKFRDWIGGSSQVESDVEDREAYFAAASFTAMEASVTEVVDSVPVITGEQLKPMGYFGQTSSDPFVSSHWDGGKFITGFGPTQVQIIDYFALRARSAQLFNENMYARGVVRRLVTNEINIGLTPEIMLDENILGISEDTMAAWSEATETRFLLWGRNAQVCDWKRKDTFGELQRIARMEAIVSGDVLIILRHSRRTRLQQIQLVDGAKIVTPIFKRGEKIRKGHTIKHGVELDREARIFGYWVRQEGGTFKFLPAFGERSGRRIAWLVFGTDKRVDDVRGQPLLALMLQSLKEIDRYRDSAQRQAVVNSVLAMFIQKDQDKMGTLPVTGGAVRKDVGQVTDADGSSRTFAIARQIPGMVIEELQTGEKPVAFTNGTDLDFESFERAIIQGIAWANEIPPEILTLSFASNYSASQAALNEFRIYLNLVWMHWGETFCQPIYIEWLISETLLRNINAPGLIEAWRNPSKYEVFGAWIRAAWYGSVKPTTDPLKQVKASALLIREGWSTNSREARHLTGTQYGQNIKKLKRENEMKVDALRPIAEFEQEFGELPGGEDGDESPIPQAVADLIQEIVEDANPKA